MMSHIPTGNVGNQIGQRHVKVAAPPGGVTSWSLSWGSEAAPATTGGRRGAAASSAPSQVNAYAPTAVPAVQQQQTSSYSAPTAAVKENTVVAPRVSSGVSANVFANGSNQNSGNFITDRPTTKVHGPPGGRSQIVFG